MHGDTVLVSLKFIRLVLYLHDECSYFDLFVANFCYYAARDSGFSLKFDILMRLMSKS